MADVTLHETQIRRTVLVTGMPEIRDHRRSPFTPVQVKVSWSWGPRYPRGTFRYVEVEGTRANGHQTRVGYGVDQAGNIEPDHRNGPAPYWLRELVADILAEIAPVAAAADATPERNGRG